MNSYNRFLNTAALPLLATFCLTFLGCQTPNSPLATVPSAEDAAPDPTITLREGDVVRVAFPGAKQLDTAQIIRRDGKIVLPTFGEVRAAGLTPAQLEKHILDTFGPQLVSKEVSVTLDSAQYPVFLNGAVLRPGKIEANRPITVLEAIMEAGGFDYTKANLKSVKVIRTLGSEVKTFVVDLRGVVEGKPSHPFYVRPSDIIFVPEKFNLF
jgi:polysaccharide export outer membrane protein